jgi:hypothetical protein
MIMSRCLHFLEMAIHRASGRHDFHVSGQNRVLDFARE